MIQGRILGSTFSGSYGSRLIQPNSSVHVSFSPRKGEELPNVLPPTSPPLIKLQCFVYLMNGFLLLRLAATTKWRFLSLPKAWVWPVCLCPRG